MTLALHKRNWPLVVIALIVITLNILIIAGIFMYTANLEWWSVLIIVGALSSIYLSLMAIIKNDPAWLLLDLILPN
jgi:hypothetical protein